MEKNYFILICSDSDDIDGAKHSAFEITKSRLDKKLWPLYSGTRNRRKIKKDDVCVFYLAGKLEHRQTFCATATVQSISDWSMNNGSVDHPDILTYPPDQVIELNGVSFFEPIPVRPLLDELSFIVKGKSNWGGAFQGGTKLISKQDYEIIIK